MLLIDAQQTGDFLVPRLGVKEQFHQLQRLKIQLIAQAVGEMAQGVGEGSLRRLAAFIAADVPACRRIRRRKGGRLIAPFQRFSQSAEARLLPAEMFDHAAAQDDKEISLDTRLSAKIGQAAETEKKCILNEIF